MAVEMDSPELLDSDIVKRLMIRRISLLALLIQIALWVREHYISDINVFYVQPNKAQFYGIHQREWPGGDFLKPNTGEYEN